jgi:hypothetical protein
MVTNVPYVHAYFRDYGTVCLAPSIRPSHLRRCSCSLWSFTYPHVSRFDAR